MVGQGTLAQALETLGRWWAQRRHPRSLATILPGQEASGSLSEKQGPPLRLHAWGVGLGGFAETSGSEKSPPLCMGLLGTSQAGVAGGPRLGGGGVFCAGGEGKAWALWEVAVGTAEGCWQVRLSPA